jgi:molecular chaperone GrpE
MSKQKKHDAMADTSAEASVQTEASDSLASNATDATASFMGDAPGSKAGEQFRTDSAVLEAALRDRDTRIAGLETEVSSLKDQYLRKLADYENFRKRMFREKDDAVQFANTQLLIDLVTILDDFDRAVNSTETSRDFQALYDGVDMIRRQLLNTLETKYGLARFDSLNEPFDPNRHEAMMSEPGPCDEPQVVEEYVKGYKLRDRILRSAKVKVRMPVDSTDQPDRTANSGAASAASSN